MNQRGFTILEVLLAVSLLGIVLVAVLPAFLTYTDANSRNELRSGAASAAQQVMESLRAGDPGTLPSSGSSAVQTLFVDGNAFEIVTHYCVVAVHCDVDSRHLLTEVSFGGELVYTVETVYTEVR